MASGGETSLRSASLRQKHVRLTEQAIQAGLFLCAFVSVATTAGIIWVLAQETLNFFRQVSVVSFLTGTRWTPLFQPSSFGVLPLVGGTLLIVVGAALVAVPLGLGTGIFLSEYSSERLRGILKPVLEILAGIPTVVYGYFALTFVTPQLGRLFPSIQVFNAASASIVVGVMILPMIASLCDDALRAVPQSLRHAGYALGATRFEVSTRVVLPGAFSGVLASFVLAVSRAIGETMAVTLAAGATPRLTANPLESIQTMTAYIVQVSSGDTPHGTIEYQTLFVIAGTLFLITLFMNLISNRILQRYRQKYE